MAIGPGSGGMRLRPLDIGDVLDETFRIYRRRFVPIITTMAVVVVPSSLLSLLVVLATGFSGPQLERAFERGDYTGAIVGGAAFVLLGITTAIISLAAVGAVTLIASSGVLGQQIGVGEAYRQPFSRWWSLLLVGLITGLTLSALILTCIGIPFAFYIGLGWALSFPVIMLEGRGATAALGRSWELVRHNRWRQLVIWVLMILYTAMNLPIAVWMLRSFLLEVPIEVIEASRVDGAGLLRQLRTIIMPIIRPGLAATALICFIFAWNEFFLVVNLTTTQAATVPVFLVGFVAPEGQFLAHLSAAATIACLPVLIAGWLAQDKLVRGLSMGAVK